MATRTLKKRRPPPLALLRPRGPPARAAKRVGGHPPSRRPPRQSRRAAAAAAAAAIRPIQACGHGGLLSPADWRGRRQPSGGAAMIQRMARDLGLDTSASGFSEEKIALMLDSFDQSGKGGVSIDDFRRIMRQVARP